MRSPTQKAWNTRLAHWRDNLSGLVAVTGITFGDCAATRCKETLGMRSLSPEKARWAPLLLLVALLGGGSAQTVEVCNLANIVVSGTSTEFWHPNFEGSVGSGVTARVTLEEKDAVGTEVIVLKSIPLTHCEEQVRYFATEKPGSTVTALATYEVNSVTGIVTVTTGVTDLRSFTGVPPVCFYVYTYYDIGTQGCPATAPCIASGCTDTFCCRDTLNNAAYPCNQTCDPMEREVVFHPVREPDVNTICNDEFRDRDRVEVCVTVVDSNDPPTISCPASVSIIETASVETRVTEAITAADPDPGLNGTLRFNLVQRLPDASLGKYFEIDEVSGVILTAGILDFDRRSIYQITVIVHDLGNPQLSASCDMEINILQTAETPPRFSHEVYSTCVDEIPSTAPASFANIQRQVIRVEAYNVNTGSTEGIQYELFTSTMSGQLLSGFDPSGSVTFSLHDRYIFTSGAYDREAVSSYSFQVRAWHTDPTQSAEATIVVCVNDLNEPPRWPRSLYVTFVSERPHLETEIIHLIAEDDDSGSLNKELSYSMVSDILSVTTHGDEETHDVNSIFRLDAGGAVVVNQDISYENYRYFQFNVRVTDRDGQPDGLSADAEVFVVVVDVNDHEPTFFSTNYSQAICENFPAGTYHIPILATDPDHGTAGSLTFTLTGELSSRFVFNPATPVRTYPHLSTDHVEVITQTVLNNAIDFNYEERQSYELTIIAQDETMSEPLRAEAHAFAYICDRNDNSPVFDQTAYTTEVRENERAIIATIRVSDQDVSIENQISTLEITGGDDSNRFYLEAADEPNTWFLHVVDLDYDNTVANPRVINIMVTNAGMTLTGICHDVCPLETLTAMTTVTVTVHDVNDKCPIFNPAHYDNINVNENQTAGLMVAQLLATDADQPGTPQSTLRYYIKSNTGRGLFAVNEMTGEVTILNPPDFEEIHQITVSAYVIDLGDKGEDYVCSQAEATVEIDILNLNDNPPYWIGCPYFVNCISETVEENHFIVKVITMDVDWDGLIPEDRAGSKVQYSISTQTRTGTFVINADTGVITVANPALLDRELYAAEHIITVRATDGNHTISCNVTVLVCDANDNCPHFIKGAMTNTATVSERCGDGSAGLPVTLQFNLSSTDDDITDEHRDTAYAIVDSDPPNAPFRIERYTGQLYVTSLGVDYENVQQWTLTLVVFDEANRQCPDDSTSYCTVVITVNDTNDNHIGFETTLYPIEEITEGLEGNNHIIEELHNVDAALTVAITSVEHCPAHWFEVVQMPPTTGSWYLKVANLSGLTPPEQLDRELPTLVRHSTSGHALCIINLRASDDTGFCMTFTDEAKALIEIYDINDNDPVISTGNIVRNVPENVEVGYTVAHVAATDIDWGTNSQLHFYLVPLQDDFVINPDSGALSSSNVLDHERQTTYTFQACVDDRGTPNVRTDCIDVTLTVSDQQDHCPFLTVNPESVTRNEGDNPGDIGVTITATERDSTGVISSLTLLPADSPFELAITAGMGTSSVTANIHQSAAPGGVTDHEGQSVYHLTIVAMDNTIASTATCLDAIVVKVVIEDLADEAPVLTAGPFAATICEDTVGGEVVELHPPIDAVDLDIVLDTNQQDPDDTLTYTIIAVAPTPQNLFVMNPVTHELQLAAGMVLDRETTTSYAYDVTVTDTNSMSATGRIDITICDVNDNAPTWDCDALNATIGTALAAQFSDPTCGGITYMRQPGFSCNFRVHVPETVGVDCLLIGDVALLSYVSDRDEPNTLNSDIWLKVDHGDDEAIGLGLNPRSTTTPVDPESVTAPSDGKLYIHERLDYFKKPFHTLTLRAMDHGNPPMTGNVFFNVTLEPCNRPPTCSSQNFTYCEEKETRIGLVTAMDENDGALGELTYTITSITPPEIANSTYVELRFVNDNVEVWLMGVDYEMVKHVVVVVEASDGGNGSECVLNAATGASGGLRCTTQIEAVVLDVNDNSPRITNPPTAVHVVSPGFNENTIPVAFTVAANDIDSGNNQDIFFQITQQDPPNIFLIHPDTGELAFENALDYEEWCDTNFSATVRACDMGPLGENRFVCLDESRFQERCSDTVTIHASLQGVDDNPPVCPHILKRCISEQDYSAPNQLQIIQINCTDEDSSCPNSPATPFTYTIDNVVVYAISSGMQLSPADVTGLFQVDANGFVSVIGNIDREGREDVHNDEYLVQLTVTDGASPTPHSTTVGVVVCVEEVNDEPPVCPTTGLPLDFTDCALATATGAVYMSEDTDSPHQVISIAAHDPDLNPQLLYEIVTVMPSHPEERWTVDETGAVIYTFEHVDYEELVSNHSTDTYQIELRVRDNNTMRGTAFCELSICVRLTDVNDNPPVWNQSSYNVSSCISESAPDDLFVFSMAGLVSDADATSPNNLFELMLEDPSAPERALPFYIKAGTINIHLNTSASLDYETQTEYQLFMIAVDQPSFEQRRLSSHATLYIQICDDIFEDPRIQDICVQAPENSTDPIVLYNLRNVTTTDGDINYADIYNQTNPFFHYFLVTPPDNNLIEVDMTTGVVTLNPMNSLDYETLEMRTQYATVAVRRSNFTTAPVTFIDFQNSGFAEVKVDSYDINDNPPNLNKRPLYLRPGKNYILIPVDHLLEYGEPIGQLFATDIDSANNHAVIRYERYDPAPGEPFYFHVTELGEIQTAATFRDRIESTYNFTVEAYDNLRADPSYSDFVMIKTIITADERRIILTIDREIQEVTRDIETIVNIVNGVTGRIMIVDRIRYASSDDLSTVEVSETDVIFHCIEVDRDEITDARTIVHILDTNFVLINSRFTSQYFVAARVFPSGINQYELEIPGLIIAIIVVVLIILLICLCCCVLCCWEWRRRRSYKKKLSYMSFDEGKFITQNPVFVPPMETIEETTAIVDSGGHVEYDVQEIAVEMNREEEDEEDWLKMDQPPEWLRRVEVEEYDAWLPPPVRPAPPPEPAFVPEPTVEEETHEEVIVQRVEKKQTAAVVEKVETKVEVKPEPTPVPVMVRIAKPKVKEYDEQEQVLQMFHDYDSEGVDSDAELRLDRVPSGMMSGDEEVEIEEFTADDFGQEAFQLTSFIEDFDDADEDETKQLL